MSKCKPAGHTVKPHTVISEGLIDRKDVTFHLMNLDSGANAHAVKINGKSKSSRPVHLPPPTNLGNTAHLLLHPVPAQLF